MAKPFNDYELTLKFDQAGRQQVGYANRIYGLVKLKQIAHMIDVLDLESNPRDSKLSAITSDIIETLETTPELYALKSKGILLASSRANLLDRDRFELEFVDKSIEGVLDGGHNLLAIGHFLLQQIIEDPKELRELRSAKIWSEFKAIYRKHESEVRDFLDTDETILNIPVPVELLLPLGKSELETENFERILRDIQEARNNNAQLRQETKTDKAGYFDDLKKFVEPAIRERIEWRQNEPGDIKVADLVALAWIPLSMIDNDAIVDEDGKKVVAPSSVQTYSQKSACVIKFNDFMASKAVTSRHGHQAELHNPAVLSALKIAGKDMPKIYDMVSAKFPLAYNAADGRYGGITAVAKLNKSDKPKLAKFTNSKLEYKSPEGFLAPLVYSFQALLMVNEDGTIGWRTDPFAFFEKNLNKLVEPYVELIKEESYGYDPQKIGKSSAAYNTCLLNFENVMYRDLIK